jgi:hypothetical protein
MVGIYYLHLLQQQDKAQCLSQLPPEQAHGARLFPTSVYKAAQTLNVATSGIVYLYIYLNLFMR